MCPRRGIMSAFPLPLFSTIPSALHLYSLTQEREKKRKQESKKAKTQERPVPANL